MKLQVRTCLKYLVDASGSNLDDLFHAWNPKLAEAVVTSS